MRLVLTWLFVCTGFLNLAAEEPIALWLSWQRSPQTTMVIHWITSSLDTSDSLMYRLAGDESWKNVEGRHSLLPQGEPRFIHNMELTDLTPGRLYEFLHNDKKYFFKTAPLDLKEPVVFVEGGDFYHDDIAIVDKMNGLAADREPLFAVCGGDLAYSTNRLSLFSEKTERWMTWLNSWTRTMRTKEGRLIPLIPAIGNHEVLGHGLKTPSSAQMFYHLFSLTEDMGYRVINFGDWMTLLLLDSNHTHAVGGVQAAWLKDTLAANQHALFKFAAYHFPAYPVYTKFKKRTCADIRTHWCPLFDKFNLTTAFEHHEHLYRRSHPIKNGKVDPTGVLYVGNGAWGVTTRKPKNTHFSAKTDSIRHFYVVTLKDKKAHFEAVNEQGAVFDTFIR